MSRYAVLLVLTGLVSLMAGMALFGFISENEEAGNPAIHQTTPVAAGPSLHEIPFMTADGNVRKLGEWQQPVLVVNFWAPWCVPCRREIPALVSLQKEYKNRVQVLGIALDSPENILEFETQQEMNYPSFIAGNNIAMYNAAFNNPSSSIPFTAIIDQNRQIHYAHSGEISLDKLRQSLMPLL